MNGSLFSDDLGRRSEAFVVRAYGSRQITCRTWMFLGQPSGLTI